MPQNARKRVQKECKINDKEMAQTKRRKKNNGSRKIAGKQMENKKMTRKEWRKKLQKKEW